MTEVCLSLIKGNMGRTRPTAPKARRRADWAAAVGAEEGVKSPSCFSSTRSRSCLSKCAGSKFHSIPPNAIEGLQAAPQLCGGCCTRCCFCKGAPTRTYTDSRFSPLSFQTTSVRGIPDLHLKIGVLLLHPYFITIHTREIPG